MEEIYLEGIDGFVKFRVLDVYGFPEEKNYLGCYDIRVEVAIKSQNYLVNGEVWTNTAEIFNLIKELEVCQINLKGKIKYSPFESDLGLEIHYVDFGHIIISGKYQERADIETKLEFEFHSDQSYVQLSLEGLKNFFQKYGGAQ
jgi:hypothetical protein